jgi:hypothetical protein
MEKTCKNCNIVKNVDDFHKLKSGSMGRHPNCKECRSVVRKAENFKKKTQGSKECPKCKIIQDYSEYSKDKSSYDGCQTYCKTCQRKNMKEYYKDGGIDRFFQKLMRDLKHNSKKRKININITLEDIKDLYKKQNGKCALTGIEMTYLSYETDNKRNRNIKNISVDRIDSKKPYDIDNIQLVLSIINTIKWDLKQEDFFIMCKTIVEFNNL